MYSKSLSPSHHITLHSSSSDGKVKSRCQCGPLTCFLCCSWLMIPALWKLSITCQRGKAPAAPMDFLWSHKTPCQKPQTPQESKASAVWCSEGCLLWAAASISALQSILIHLFMPASLLLSPNRKKWPDSATVFLCTCCYPWLGSSSRIAKHLNYSASVVDSALKLHWHFLR